MTANNVETGNGGKHKGVARHALMESNHIRIETIHSQTVQKEDTKRKKQNFIV